MSCELCQKRKRNREACINCEYVNAATYVNEAQKVFYKDLTPEELEEVRFELFSRIDNDVRRVGMEESKLVKLISKCADAAVYLPKKRFEELDELRCLLVDLAHDDCYLTNGDCTVRISNLPDDTFDGLYRETPAYSYIEEKFIPNPLPYEVEELTKLFGETYFHSFSISIPILLEQIYRKWPSPVDRRKFYLVTDVGFGLDVGSVIVPFFEEVSGTGEKIFRDTGGKPMLVSKDSWIDSDSILLGIPYAVKPEYESQDVIYVNAYKCYEEKVVMGLYKLLSPAEDDLHPFNLENYASGDLMRFKLVSTIEGQQDLHAKMRTYMNFRPFMVELEYFYEVLLLYKNFGYGYANLHSRGEAGPIAIEGISTYMDQPIIETVLATVMPYTPGYECEKELMPGVCVK